MNKKDWAMAIGAGLVTGLITWLVKGSTAVSLISGLIVGLVLLTSFLFDNRSV